MSYCKRSALVLLSLLIAFSFIPAQAQDVSLGDDFEKTEGIESAVLRLWSVDEEAFLLGTPGAELEMPARLVTLGMVWRFDNHDHAEAAFSFLKDGGAEQLIDLQFDGVITDVDDLGERAFSIEAPFDEADFSGVSRLLISQQDEYIYLAMTLGSTADDVTTADALVQAMVNDADPDDGDGTFAEDGTSSGGLWTVFPADDSDFLSPLINRGDQILFPIPEATA